MAILCFTTNSYGRPFLSIITDRWCFGIGNRWAIAKWIVEQTLGGIGRPAPHLKVHRQGARWVVMVPR